MWKNEKHNNAAIVKTIQHRHVPNSIVGSIKNAYSGMYRLGRMWFNVVTFDWGSYCITTRGRFPTFTASKQRSSCPHLNTNAQGLKFDHASVSCNCLIRASTQQSNSRVYFFKIVHECGDEYANLVSMVLQLAPCKISSLYNGVTDFLTWPGTTSYMPCCTASLSNRFHTRHRLFGQFVADQRMQKLLNAFSSVKY